MSDLKISQLTAATTSKDTDQLVIVRGSTNMRTPKQLLLASVVASVATAQNTANSAASAAATADGKADAAQADATQALSDAAAADANADTRVPKATATAGLPSPFNLNVPRNVGTFASPVSGNITIDLTGATYDGVAVVYHDDATEPTISVTGGSARKFGTANYDTAKVNVILIYWNGGTDVAYSYVPEQ